MKTTQTLTTLLPKALFIAVLFAGLAHADIGPQQARILLEQKQILPLEQIINKAVAVKPGQVIETELEEDDGVYSYELEILDENGIVWELELDAKTGELLELEKD
jgi:uncharacterized membrane protein YkoI